VKEGKNRERGRGRGKGKGRMRGEEKEQSKEKGKAGEKRRSFLPTVMDVEKSAPTSTGGSVGVQSVMRPRRPSLSNPHDRARNLTQADIRACSPPTCFVDFMSASVAYVI